MSDTDKENHPTAPGDTCAQQQKAARLMNSEQAALEDFSGCAVINGGCVECDCEVLLFYHYDNGNPVPNAPFTLTDSKGNVINGRVNEHGLCHIKQIACGVFGMQLYEGEDEFIPPQVPENNPLFRKNSQYAGLAAEYVSLYVLLSRRGLPEWHLCHVGAEQKEQEEGYRGETDTPYITADNSGQEYRQAYNRFQQLDRLVNAAETDLALRSAVNHTFHSLAAEVADGSGSEALLLAAEIILCLVPVVSQAADIHYLTRWCDNSCENPELLNDPLHLAAGALAVIGFVPGSGVAIRKSGQIVTDFLCAVADNPAKESELIRRAVRQLRGLSDGSLTGWITTLISSLQKYAEEAVKLLADIRGGLSDFLAKEHLWLTDATKTGLKAILSVTDRLAAGFAEALEKLTRELEVFAGKIFTLYQGTATKAGAVRKTATAAAQSIKPQITRIVAASEKTQRTVAEDTTYLRRETDAAHSNAGARSSAALVCRGDPVDMATGCVTDRRTDFELSGLPVFALRRHYCSGAERYPGLLGSLWRTTLDISLHPDNGVAQFTDEFFNHAWYALPDEGEYRRAAHRPEYCLTRRSGLLVLEHLSGESYTFGHARGITLLLSAITDRSGNRISLERDGGRLVCIVLADGRRIVPQYTGHGCVSRFDLLAADATPVRCLAEYCYDKNRYLTAVRAAAGHSFDYGYDGQGRMLSWADLSRSRMYHEYDERGRAVRNWSSDRFWHDRISFDDENLTTYYHNGYGGTETYVRDERNNILLIRAPDGGEQHFAWQDNQLAAYTDPQGRRTEYRRNERGQITMLIAPDGSKHCYCYDENGNLHGYTNPLNHSWQYRYDEWGRLISETDPDGLSWRYILTRQGLLQRQEAADGSWQEYRYNTRGLLTEILSGQGLRTGFTYDEHDRLTQESTTDEAGTRIRRWHYCGTHNRPAETEYENGSRTRYRYDEEGCLTCITDGQDHQWQYRYGSFDILSGETTAEGGIIRYHYDSQTRAAGVTDGGGKTFRYHTGSCGRITEEEHYDGRIYRSSYYPDGRLKTRTAPDGSVLEYHYNTAGRLSRLRATESDGTYRDTTYRYDAAGRLTLVQNPDATTEYSYSPGGKILSETINGETVSRTYDTGGQPSASQGLLAEIKELWHEGRLRKLTVGQSGSLALYYDMHGRETLRVNGRGFSLAQGYTPQGLLNCQQLGDDSACHTDRMSRSYHYDCLYRLSGIKEGESRETRYCQDGCGRIISEHHREGSSLTVRHFSYDHTDSLTHSRIQTPDISGAEYPWPPEQGGQQDRLSNEKPELHLQYDDGGRVIRRESPGEFLVTEYGYDANGRLTSRREIWHPPYAGRETRITRFSWNAQDRLASVITADGTCWQYKYDPFGRRISKTRIAARQRERREMIPCKEDFPRSLHTDSEDITQVNYRWDGARLAAERRYREDGSLIREVQWLYEPYSFVPLAQLEKTGNTCRLYYIVSDPAGIPRELCGEDGKIYQRKAPELWADRLRDNRNSIHLQHTGADGVRDRIWCDLGFQGQLSDQETGFYYNNQRYYCPETCQYISSDPIAPDGGINFYSYVPNPLSWIDPLGLMPWAWDPNGMGHHLVPRNKANSIGLTELGTMRNTPTFFPDPYSSGMHEELHRTIKGDIGKIQGPWTGTADDLFNATSRNLESVSHIRGDLRIPSTGEVLASGVTPKEAHAKLLEWFSNKRAGEASGGKCG